jgi:hypothetical protein
VGAAQSEDDAGGNDPRQKGRTRLVVGQFPKGAFFTC